jgi:hypothetical protein
VRSNVRGELVNEERWDRDASTAHIRLQGPDDRLSRCVRRQTLDHVHAPLEEPQTLPLRSPAASPNRRPAHAARRTIAWYRSSIAFASASTFDGGWIRVPDADLGPQLDRYLLKLAGGSRLLLVQEAAIEDPISEVLRAA